jgi:hypothetical protein
MIAQIFRRRIKDINALFIGHYIEVKAFYVMQFNEVPCVSFISELDTGKAYDFIVNRFRNQVKGTYQHNYFDHDKQQFFFNNTLFMLGNKRMIELGNNFCHVLHSNRQYDFGNELVKELSAFRVVPENINENRVIGFARSNHMKTETN